MGSDTRQGSESLHAEPCGFVVDPESTQCPRTAVGEWRSPLTGAQHPLCARHGALMARMARWVQVR